MSGTSSVPSTYDLGEDLRLVLLSVTEGEDKPLKYPTIFHTADVAVITKSDLAAAAEFNRTAVYRNIRSVRPDMQVFEVSARTGEGMDPWLRFLESRRVESRPGRGSNPEGAVMPATRKLNDPGKPAFRRLGILPQQ